MPVIYTEGEFELYYGAGKGAEAYVGQFESAHLDDSGTQLSFEFKGRDGKWGEYTASGNLQRPTLDGAQFTGIGSFSSGAGNTEATVSAQVDSETPSSISLQGRWTDDGEAETYELFINLQA